MQVKTYDQQSYDGGLNDTTAPQEISQIQASVLRNWDITLQGKLTRRDGLTPLAPQLSGLPIMGLGSFLRNNGNDLLCIEGTNLYYLAGNSWTKIANNLTAGKKFWMENIKVFGKIFFGNEDNQLQSWDRNSTTLNSCISILASTIPHGNVLRWHKNHLFTINNVNVSGTKYPNRLYWSNFGDPLTWDTTNNFFEIPGDGRALTAVDLGDSLVLFKERAIQYLTGWGATDWAITASKSNVANLSEEIGIAGERSATRVGDEIWFVDNQGQIRRITRTDFDAFRHDIISLNIQGTLQGLNKTQLSQSVAWTWNNKVFFAFPNGTDTTNSLVCVFDIIAARRQSGEQGVSYGGSISTEAWTTYTGWFPSLFADYPSAGGVPDFYVGDARFGKVYKHTGTDDDGTPIDARWDGKDDEFGSPMAYKRYRFGYITAQSGQGDANVQILASVNLSPFATLGQINLVGAGSRLGPTGSFRLGPTGNATLSGAGRNQMKFYYTDGGGSATGRSLRHSIRHNLSGQKPIVNTFTSHFVPRSVR